MTKKKPTPKSDEQRHREASKISSERVGNRIPEEGYDCKT